MIVKSGDLYGIALFRNGQEKITWEDGTVEQHECPSPFESVYPRTEVYQRDGIEYREQVVPEGWVVIDTFIPHSVPWDIYGMQHTLDVWQKLIGNNIPAAICNIQERRLAPCGSGPEGSIRFGDDMLPGTFRVAVPRHLASRAEEALK